MLVLKQSTSVDIRLGPFVAVADGFTPITAAQTLANWDQAEVLKSNGAATVSMAGAIAAVTGCGGWYDYTVATGDVDTVGEVVFVCQDESVFLPVFVRAMVVEEAVYDAYYLAAATGIPSTAATQTNITAGTITTVTNLTNAPTAGDLTATMKASVNTEAKDVLFTDTTTEPAQGAPSQTATLATKINTIFKFMVNKKTATNSLISVYNSDETTVDHKSTISDDATTYTEGEYTTGP